jgi:hypothetical protein
LDVRRNGAFRHRNAPLHRGHPDGADLQPSGRICDSNHGAGRDGALGAGMSRQAAQRKLEQYQAMPIDHDCAKFPDFPSILEMNRACDAWLRKRGLIQEFIEFGYGRKTKNQQTEKHDNETNIL